jgi:hypothetical protein
MRRGERVNFQILVWAGGQSVQPCRFYGRLMAAASARNRCLDFQIHPDEHPASLRDI